MESDKIHAYRQNNFVSNPTAKAGGLRRRKP